MESDLTSKLPIREHMKNMKKIIRVVTEMDRTYFLWTSVVHIINVIIPYAQLLLLAYILDSLVEKRSFSEIFSIAVGAVLGIFLLSSIASMIWNRMEVRVEKMYYVYACYVQTKMMQMDYSRIDSPEVRDLEMRIIKDMNWGAGLYTVFRNVNAIFFRVYLNKKLFHDIVKYTRYSVLFKYTATICRSLSNLFQYLQATFSRFKRQISDKF